MRKKQREWETLDVASLLGIELPEEAGQAGVTTTANVGAYPVPIGPVLRRQMLTRGVNGGQLQDIPSAYRELLGLKKKKR
jgi:hypothetical protein